MLEDYLQDIEDTNVRRAVEEAHQATRYGDQQRPARLTLSLLMRFATVETNREPIEPVSSVEQAIVETGTYYFGPMFSIDRGSSVPTDTLIREFKRQGFLIGPLHKLDNGQLNLLFITAKGLGIVSDQALVKSRTV